MAHAREYYQHFTNVIDNGADYWPRIGRVPLGVGPALMASRKHDCRLTGDVVKEVPRLGGSFHLNTSVDRKTSLPGTQDQELLFGQGIVHLAAETLLVGIHGLFVFSPYAANMDKIQVGEIFRERSGQVPVVVVPRREVIEVALERVKVLGIHTQDLVHIRGRHPDGIRGSLTVQISWLHRPGSQSEDVVPKNQAPALRLLEAWRTASR